MALYLPMSRTSTLLITAPDYDLVTRYLSAWAVLCASELSAHHHQVHMLKGNKVNRKNFEGYITKNKPNVVFINGHGSHDTITGHEYDVIADVRSATIFKGTEVYALSCKSAIALGAAAMSAGAKAYIGYVQDFILVSQPDKTTHPKDDATASLFLEPSKVIVTTLAKGHGPEVAIAKGRQAYNESIRKALNSDVQSDDDKFISFLVWNRQFLTSC